MIHVGCKEAFQESRLEKITVTCPMTGKELVLSAHAFFWKEEVS